MGRLFLNRADFSSLLGIRRTHLGIGKVGRTWGMPKVSESEKERETATPLQDPSSTRKEAEAAQAKLALFKNSRPIKV